MYNDISALFHGRRARMIDRYRALLAGAAALILIMLLAGDTNASLPGIIERVSVNSEGVPGNGVSVNYSTRSAISDDGRYVTFVSRANNLVPNDNNAIEDAFVRDRMTRTTERVSVNSSGVEGNGQTFYPTISANGRYVAFESWATNLVLDDTNGHEDIFVRDRVLGITERVSVDSDGFQIGGYGPAISPDGQLVVFIDATLGGKTRIHDRQTKTTEVFIKDLDGKAVRVGDIGFSPDSRYVAFATDNPKIVIEDTNERSDVFLLDRQTDSIELVSVDSNEIQGNKSSRGPSVSEGGRYVAFSSESDNLGEVFAEHGGIFVRDRNLGTTELVSVSSTGEPNNSGVGSNSDISAAGRFVVFGTSATNMVPDDQSDLGEIFIRDREDKTTDRVVYDLDGNEVDSRSGASQIAANGCCVSFYTTANNLVIGTPDPFPHVYVNDLDGITFPTPTPTPSPTPAPTPSYKVFLPTVLD